MTDSDVSPKDRRVVYKVVLTGGPCAGKTTTVARLRTFFEGLGWKVYTVPEAATILLGGRDKWADMTVTQDKMFQKNILATILQLEKTFFDLATEDSCNVIIVCDRGGMDPSAFCSEERWKETLTSLDLDLVQLRDTRYDQVVHMVTAADGADSFYQKTNNPTRTETIELAKEMDAKAVQAWVGHPYVDIVDNSTDFENKVRRVIEAVCKRLGNRLGVDIDDRLQAQSRKRLFLVKSVPDIRVFPTRVCDVEVQYDYLLGTTSQSQTRIRKRGQHGQYMFTLTEREIVNGEKVEQKRQLTSREYQTLCKQKDPNHHAIVKTRYCFLWKGHYFQLDDFREPEKCHKLVFLETFTTKRGSDLELPDFLEIDGEVTDNPDYSMYVLSAKKHTADHN